MSSTFRQRFLAGISDRLTGSNILGQMATSDRSFKNLMQSFELDEFKRQAEEERNKAKAQNLLETYTGDASRRSRMADLQEKVSSLNSDINLAENAFSDFVGPRTQRQAEFENLLDTDVTTPGVQSPPGLREDVDAFVGIQEQLEGRTEADNLVGLTDEKILNMRNKVSEFPAEKQIEFWATTLGDDFGSTIGIELEKRKPKTRIATPDEIKSAGLPSNNIYQVSPTGQYQLVYDPPAEIQTLTEDQIQALREGKSDIKAFENKKINIPSNAFVFYNKETKKLDFKNPSTREQDLRAIKNIILSEKTERSKVLSGGKIDENKLNALALEKYFRMTTFRLPP
tara:strand:- start:833 stop:1855 length:1023 start_codon:yes stop_codon:yes gene_type:complete